VVDPESWTRAPREIRAAMKGIRKTYAAPQSQAEVRATNRLSEAGVAGEGSPGGQCRHRSEPE
jgi:hypothetical protein